MPAIKSKAQRRKFAQLLADRRKKRKKKKRKSKKRAKRRRAN
jgi:hypothetical protein